MRSIEIYWNKQIQRVTFPLQSECDFIKDSIKDKIKSRIDYTDDDKVDEFLEGVHELQVRGVAWRSVAQRGAAWWRGGGVEWRWGGVVV